MFFKKSNFVKSVSRVHYLMDLENVQSEGFKGCEELREEDIIHIFYTENSKKVDLDIVANHGKAHLETIKVAAGKQSLDMHLVSYLGFLIGLDKEKLDEYVVISKDTDFDNVINFWKQSGIQVSRRHRIDKNYVPSQSELNSKPKSRRQTTKPQSTKKPADKPADKTVPKKPVNSKPSETKKEIVKERPKQADNSLNIKNDTLNTKPESMNADIRPETLNVTENVKTDLKPESVKPDFKPETVKPDFKPETAQTEAKVESKPATSKTDAKIESKPAAAKTDTKTDTKVDSKPTNKDILQILTDAGFTSDITSYVVPLVGANKGESNSKQLIYRQIISKFGQAKGLNIYNHIKKHI